MPTGAEHWVFGHWAIGDLSLLFYSVEWLIRLVMLVYVPQRRTPAAARTWLLLIFLLPIPGLILYALFGRAFMPRKRLEMQSRVSRMLQMQPGPTWGERPDKGQLPRRFGEAGVLAERIGEFPIVGGNEIELFPDYDESVARLAADIRGAQHHVHLLYYIFGDDAVGRVIEAALVDAVRRGVKCLLLIDALGSRKAIATICPRLRAAGVEVHVLLPGGLLRNLHRNAARYDLRNHRKIAVIDGAIGYVGSQNLVDKAFIPPLVYEELVARVVGPVVKQLQAVVLADRYFETGTLPPRAETEKFFPSHATSDACYAQALPSGPGYPQANNLRLITTLVYAAQKRIILTTPYFVPDETLREALIVAAQKGVEVRLIVSKQCDQLLVGFAQRSFYEELLEADVAIHLYRERFLHVKHLSVDDQVVQIGSSNLDIRSFALNAEIGLMIYDVGLAKRLRDVQLRYLEQSDVLTLDVWRRRPRYRRLLENVARLVDSIL